MDFFQISLITDNRRYFVIDQGLHRIFRCRISHQRPALISDVVGLQRFDLRANDRSGYTHALVSRGLFGSIPWGEGPVLIGVRRS